MLFYKTLLLYTKAFFFGLLITGCGGISEKSRFPDTAMYNLSKPTVIELPESLDEISGIAYYPKDTSVFAIVDEDGLLFKIPIKNPQANKSWKFDKKRDFEDVVLVDSSFYILVSNGDIETVKFKGDSIVAQKSNFSGQTKKTNEFETLYLNSDSGNLVMVCKECEEDTKKTVSSYTFNYQDSVKVYKPYIVFDGVAIAARVGIEKVHIKPSAAAINPATGELYMISSLHHILIITSKDGKIKEVYKLNPALYKQPEGIAFTPMGDLIISNERADVGSATLLVLKNKLKGR